MAPQDDLTAERAAQLYGSLTCTTYREGYQDPENDIALIAEELKTARQEALREARETVLAEILEDIPDNEADESYNLAIGHAAHALDRLASEGG